MERHKRQRFFLLGILSLLLVVFTQTAWSGEPATPIGPGAIYQGIYRPEGPWAIHVVEADLSQEYLELRALLGSGASMGRRQVSDMMMGAEAEDVRPVAAVNGDFFSLAGGSLEGVPLGLHVEAGELVTFPDPLRSVFYLLSDGTAHIDCLRANVWLRVSGKMLQIGAMNRPPGPSELVLFTPRFSEQTKADPSSTQISLVSLTGPVRPNAEVSARVASVSTGAVQRIPPEGAVLVARGVAAYALRNVTVGDEVSFNLVLDPEKGEIKEAVSGGPRLLRGGAITVEYQRERFSEQFASRRHPRTGIGIRNGTVVMVTVDGRQPGYSEGMTLYEFAQLFIELGCTEAMNLDGGGSATMVVRGQVMNSPSGGRQRAVVNGLGVFSAAPLGPPVQLAVAPREASVLSGERVTLKPTGVDQYYNPVPVDSGQVEWQAPADFGAISKAGVFTAAEVTRPTVGLVMAKLGDMTASVVVKVAAAPARIVVLPAKVTLSPNQAQRFSAAAYDDQGRLLSVSPGRIVWQAEPAAGAQVDQSGMVRTLAVEGPFSVQACLLGVCGTAEVIVGGAQFALVQDFEKGGQGTYRGEPASCTGSVDWVADDLRPNNHCLRMNYDFSGATGTRTANAELNLPLPEAEAFAVSVLGDGQGGWLRARLRDGAGRVFVADLASKVNWSGSWRRLTAQLPEDASPPVTLESVYLAEYHDEHKPVGAIYFDEIAVRPPSTRQDAKALTGAKSEGG